MKKRETAHSLPPALFTPIADSPTVRPSAFLDEELWTPSNTRKFILFAARLIARRPWRRSDYDAADVVSEAKTLLISGERRYTARYSPQRCVYATIASIVSHGGYSAENRLRVDVDGPGEVLLPDIQEMVEAREYLEKYKTNFSDDAHRRYLDLLAEGYVPTADAARELDLLETDIWKIRKNLRRPRKKWPGKPPEN